MLSKSFSQRHLDGIARFEATAAECQAMRNESAKIEDLSWSLHINDKDILLIFDWYSPGRGAWVESEVSLTNC